MPAARVVSPAAVAVGLTIAGFDPSGGAGVLADLKTFAAHGLYGEACITTLTVQNTQGVAAARPLGEEWIAATLDGLASDNAFNVIKIGALGSSNAAAVVSTFLSRVPGVPVVLDPVIRSSSGMELLDAAGIDAMKRDLLPLVHWLTPNFAELGSLTGRTVDSTEEAEKAAEMLQIDYPNIYFLITGGGLEQPSDYLLQPGQAEGRWIPGNFVDTRATHGTGCTLSSALAARVALYPSEDAAVRVAEAKRYVEGAMRHAPGIGLGAGPLEHFWQARG